MWSARASKIYYNELSSRFLCVGPISTYYFTHNAIQTAAAYGSSLNQPLHGLYPKGPVQRCFNYLVYTALTLSCAYSYLLTVFYSYTVFWSPNLCLVSTTSTLDFSLIRQQGKAWGGKKTPKKLPDTVIWSQNGTNHPKYLFFLQINNITAMHIYFLEQSLLVHQRLKYSGANTLVHTHPILTFSHSLSQNKPKKRSQISNEATDQMWLERFGRHAGDYEDEWESLRMSKRQVTHKRERERGRRNQAINYFQTGISGEPITEPCFRQTASKPRRRRTGR